MQWLTVRVYGILVNNNKSVLVSDELISGEKYTKFPGGGLEYGEGPVDCLKRECKEELGIEVQINDHLYTTEHFHASAFGNAKQIISIYYWVTPLEDLVVENHSTPFHFTQAQLETYQSTQQIEALRYIAKNDFKEDAVTLPIDKIVAKIVKSYL